MDNRKYQQNLTAIVRTKTDHLLEPEIREYLIRIVNTIGIVIMWMIVNSTTGIMMGYAFMEGGLTLGNVIFYFWLIISSSFLIWHLIKLWSKPLNIPK